MIFTLCNITYVSFAKEKPFYEEDKALLEKIVICEENEILVEKIEKEEEHEILEEKITTDEESKILEDTIKTNDIEIKKSIWELEIPKINLRANISEGTTNEVMNEYIGHFQNTSIYNGNVGLAAHNRGYPVNYFGRIKELVSGDEIIYRCEEGEKRYIVNLITIISDTDWHYLENNGENKITLITCVENKPNLRRCIQGIEKT